MPIDVGHAKQLFLDDRWFFSQQGMTLRVNPPVKAERVLLPEQPWETRGIHGYSTVLEDDGLYKLWYDAIAPGGKPHSRSICYATSQDGVHWERQYVNLFSWEGITPNNIVMPGTNGSVMLDPNGPDEHRYKAAALIHENEVWPESRGCIAGMYEGYGKPYFIELYLCTSPDGIHWRRQGTAALPFFHDTQNQLFYDTRLGKYVAYVRTQERRRTVGRTEFDDPLDLPWPFQANPAAIPGPGTSRWAAGGEFQLALACDELDPVDTDLYTPNVEQYPWAADAYFSFTAAYRHYPFGDTADTTAVGKDARGRFRNDGPVEVQLAVSRDGINWSRPDRRPYVPLGLAGSWDGGQTYMALGMIRKGDEIWQYYSGTDYTHGAYERDAADYSGGLCRLVQRLDGFVSADADYQGAVFTTPLLTFDGAHLQLNCDCGAMGEIWIELRDERNHPIPGYTLAESISVDRNQVAAPVRWQERENVGELIGRPVRVHAKLRACKLYAFQFAQQP